MTIKIEEASMWGERDMEKKIEERILEIIEARESGLLKEDDVFELIVDPDDSSMTMTIQALRRFSSTSDILKYYKESIVDSLSEYRRELELDREEGVNRRRYLIN
jgi:hypothetical protein